MDELILEAVETSPGITEYIEFDTENPTLILAEDQETGELVLVEDPVDSAISLVLEETETELKMDPTLVLVKVSMPVDNYLSALSENPVQNKVIKAALDRLVAGTGGIGGTGIDQIIVCDQADYDAMTEHPDTTLYIILG